MKVASLTTALSTMNISENLEKPIERQNKGQQTRERLLKAATEVFATKGFQSATTREICEAADSNMAAIHYHFKDKEGLYRAVVQAPLEQFAQQTQGFEVRGSTFKERMRALYAGLLNPMTNQDPMFQHHLRIHFRELVEPTVIAEEVFEQSLVPFVQKTQELIAAELSPQVSHDEIACLSYAMIGMAMDLYTSRPCLSKLSPTLFKDTAAFENLFDRFSGYAAGMLEHERQRLALSSQTQSPPNSQSVHS
jgi:TetR/AcrR family transcriptional regulator, regulator of cefoperazone and chloramphenicol sensitivity